MNDPLPREIILAARRELAELLRDYRASLGLSQQQVANCLDCNRELISMAENARGVSADIFRPLKTHYQKAPGFDEARLDALQAQSSGRMDKGSARFPRDKPDKAQGFGLYLRDLRIRAGLSQEKLGIKTGTTTKNPHIFINNLEKEAFLPSPESVVKLAKAMALQGDEKDEFYQLGVPDVARQWYPALEETGGYLAFHAPWLESRETQKQSGLYLKALRESQNLALATVGAAIGKGYGTILNWESGRNFPQLQPATALKNYLASFATPEQLERFDMLLARSRAGHKRLNAEKTTGVVIEGMEIGAMVPKTPEQEKKSL